MSYAPAPYAPVAQAYPARRPVSWIRHKGGERRLDEESARLLARQVFYKYDANRSGFMNSVEAASMVSDLYLSINENKPSHQQDGLDFMVANDINNDHSMSLEDFEDIFVKHLSSHDDSGYSLTNPMVTAVVHDPEPLAGTPRRMVQQFPNGLPSADPRSRATHPVVEVTQQPGSPQQQQPIRQGAPLRRSGAIRQPAPQYAPQQQYAPAPQQQYAPAPQQQYAPQPQYAQAPVQGQYVQSQYPGQR